MTKRYDWLLFDADNTLFDFHQCEGLALRRAMENKGLSFLPQHHDLYREINVQCWREFERRVITKEELRLKRFLLFFEAVDIRTDPAEFGTEYLKHLSTAAFLLDGAIELLQHLQPHFRLALVTNGLREVQRPRLTAGALNPFFEVIIVSDEIGHAKPHRPFFDHTFREIGGPDRKKVLIIGDNLHADIKGGLDYGIDACWFNPEGKAKAEGIQPTYEIRVLEELKRILG